MDMDAPQSGREELGEHVSEDCVGAQDDPWLRERPAHGVLTPRALPANDGGISYGQAAVAAAR